MNLITLIKMYPIAMYLWSVAISLLIFLFNFGDAVDYMQNKCIANKHPIIPNNILVFALIIWSMIPIINLLTAIEMIIRFTFKFRNKK